MSATRALLDDLIDDAGLFPPAQLSMADALQAHERAQAGETSWMLGRFVVPASRLDELDRALDDAPRALATSVVLDGDDPSAALEHVRRAREGGERIGVCSIEARASQFGPDAAVAFVREAAAHGVPGDVVCYLEIVPGDRTEDELAAIRRAREARHAVCAKIRCGGVTPGAVPHARQLAAFMTGTKRHGVPFKATAGLHHPIAHDNAAAGFWMHGFLNVIGAAVLLHAGELDAGALEAMLCDEAPDHFRLDAERFGWLDSTVDATSIRSARAFAHSYGSCSFEEPVADLRTLGMLGARRAQEA